MGAFGRSDFVRREVPTLGLAKYLSIERRFRNVLVGRQEGREKAGREPGKFNEALLGGYPGAL